MATTEIDNLTQLFLDGNHIKALHLLDAQEDQSRFGLLKNLFTPTMYKIGEMWERNEISVADEHLATGVCDFLLSRMFPIHQNCTSNKKAMFLCIEGEQHSLGLKMVCSLFEEKGWNTKNFGSSLPLLHAVTYAKSWKPDVIGLSISITYYLPELKHYINKLSELPHKPTILVGGRIIEKYKIDSEDAIFLTHIDDVNNWLNTNTKERMDATS